MRRRLRRSPGHQHELTVRCDYFEAGACRSCTSLHLPYPAALAAKDASVRELLAGQISAGAWLDPVASAESGFRNKAKLVIGGTTQAPTLGILDGDRRGVDLRRCGLYEPELAAALPRLAEFISEARLIPYEIAARRGELKHLLVTRSPTGDLLVRFVLRSTHQLAVVRNQLPRLLSALPQVRVVSVNLQPIHQAIVEGDREIVLTDTESLAFPVNDLVLEVRPNSFFQTNTAVAAALYRQARAWAALSQPASVWDLYCGVGGFALHLAAAGREVTAVETSPEAVAAGTASAQRLGLGASFVAGDALAWASQRPAADLVVVNPPRRGLGPQLAAYLDSSDARTVVYSSCNAQSLARDVGAMPGFTPVSARLFDMFPQTSHHEVMVLLQRR